MKPYEKLQRYWQETETGIVPVAPNPEAVMGLERRYGVELPEDFRDYLLHSCPPESEALDKELTGWWALDRIKNIPDEDPGGNYDLVAASAAQYLFFADHLFWCGAWAIHCGEGANRGRVVMIMDGEKFVADNFASFVDRYIEDFHQLL